MKINLPNLIELLPSLAKNAHLDISLSGWPAFASIAVACGSAVTAYAIKVNTTDHSQNNEQNITYDSDDSTDHQIAV